MTNLDEDKVLPDDDKQGVGTETGDDDILGPNDDKLVEKDENAGEGGENDVENLDAWELESDLEE